jgi:DNA-binding response OmpR family regulator
MRLLVVEDDKDIQKFLKTAFQSECYIVDVANDGKKGSFLARTNEYDVIILDINLPEKSGLSICKEVREDGISTPILILSVQSEIPAKLDLFTAGADDYLTKPFSFEELLARVKALTRRPKGIDTEVLLIGDLKIDTVKNEIMLDSKKIPLTRKEYILLEYLAKNKDRIISRGAIMEHVWDMNADPFSNTIEVHIRNIRKKLGLPSNRNLIRTISGRGYMLDSSEASTSK